MASEFTERALDFARGELAAGVHGGQPSRFRGPEIDEYFAAVGLDPGHPWCAAAIYFGCDQSAEDLGLLDPCPRTAGALHMLELVALAYRVADLSLVGEGCLFFLDKGGGRGHCGWIEEVRAGGLWQTLEGDTNAAGSSRGDAWGRHVWNPLDGTRGRLAGVVDFSRAGALPAPAHEPPDAPEAP